MDYEIQVQMEMKVNQKMHGEKMEKSDFVKPSRSENLLYRQQVETLDETINIIERDNEWLLNADEQTRKGHDFDKEEFKRIRDQIKQKKEAKQRIIEQGFPELQPYARI